MGRPRKPETLAERVIFEALDLLRALTERAEPAPPEAFAAISDILNAVRGGSARNPIGTETAPKLHRNCTKTAPKPPENCTETAPKLHQNGTVTEFVPESKPANDTTYPRARAVSNTLTSSCSSSLLASSLKTHTLSDREGGMGGEISTPPELEPDSPRLAYAPDRLLDHLRREYPKHRLDLRNLTPALCEVVDTESMEQRVRDGLAAWRKSEEWGRGVIPNASKFIREMIFARPPESEPEPTKLAEAERLWGKDSPKTNAWAAAHGYERMSYGWGRRA